MDIINILMIVWIASYPKSGNTWIRSFLYSLLYSNDHIPDLDKIDVIDQYPTKKYFKKFIKNFNNFKEMSKYWDASQTELNLDKKIKFFKTHHINCKIDNNSFTELENTLGVIHIVRDPRNIITSLKNHYSKQNYLEALDFISDPLHCIDVENKSHKYIDKTMILNTLISSWNNHYNSWKNFSKNYLLIKYEDLEENPKKTFKKLTDYLEINLKFEIDNKKIDKIIELNSFENLKKIEVSKGFKEAAVNENNKKNEFFYLGPMNKWKNLLSNDIITKIETIFKKEMKELKYLD